MNLKLKFLVFFIIGALQIHSQADCIFVYQYCGEIESSKHVVESIGLPESYDLSKYSSELSTDSFYKLNVDNKEFSQVLFSHLSSYHCDDMENIINFVFKRTRKTFPMIICVKGKEKPIKLEIPIKEIGFVSTKDKNLIEINFGRIKL